MKQEEEQLAALQDIRRMMKESSRFLSLSGMSGIFAGVYALAGAWLGHSLISGFNGGYPRGLELFEDEYRQLAFQLFFICAGVLLLAVLTALYLSNKKAQKNGHRLFDHTSRRLLWSMLAPLVSGGLFCLAMIWQGNGFLLLISPIMLIFYGIALISSSRYTLNDVKYLGYFEVLIGLLACFNLGSGILFWALGFGIMHIVYGSIMWFKYDRK